MINPAYFIGLPQEVQQIPGVYVYPPAVEDILSNKYFGVYRQLLTTSQEEIEDKYVEKKKDLKDLVTPLEELFQMLSDDGSEESKERKKQIYELLKDAFKFFLHEEVFFAPDKKIIFVGDVKEQLQKAKSVHDLKIITEQNYFFLQNAIRESLGEKAIEPPNPNEDPRVKRIKAKARYRDKIKAKKGGGIDLGSSLVAICCMGIGLTPLNIGKISYASVARLTTTYQEKEKYEIDVRSLQAGAKKKDVNLKYWIRKIED